MTLKGADQNAFYDELCRYGASPQTCRGPIRDLQTPDFAFLGGSETFGKFALRPYVEILEDMTGHSCVNLGCSDLGLDALLADEDLLSVAETAEQVVIQVLPATNLTNPFYRVHPRRNDRLVEPMEALRTLYPEIDFTHFHYCRHLLATLRETCEKRFTEVARTLQEIWQDKMFALVERFGNAPVLLWLDYEAAGSRGAEIGPHSLLIEREMLSPLRGKIAGLIEMAVKPACASGDVTALQAEALFAPGAAHMIGQTAHYEIAEVLQRGLKLPHQMKRPA